MTVKDLKAMLDGIDDEMEVFIPANSEEFDGRLYSPCAVDSGLSQIADVPDEDMQDYIENGEDTEWKYPTKDIFMLVPCGYSEEKDHSHVLN